MNLRYGTLLCVVLCASVNGMDLTQPVIVSNPNGIFHTVSITRTRPTQHLVKRMFKSTEKVVAKAVVTICQWPSDYGLRAFAGKTYASIDFQLPEQNEKMVYELLTGIRSIAQKYECTDMLVYHAPIHAGYNKFDFKKKPIDVIHMKAPGTHYSHPKAVAEFYQSVGAKIENRTSMWPDYAYEVSFPVYAQTAPMNDIC